MPFEPGQSGNPGGRSKDKPFRDALRIELAKAGKDGQRLRLVAKALIEQAERGDVPAIREIADRLDGKAPQAITGADGGPVQVSVMRFSEELRAHEKPDDGPQK